MVCSFNLLKKIKPCFGSGVYHRSLNAEARVRSRASSSEICGGQRGTGAGLSPVTWGFFSVGTIPPKFHTHISHICCQDLYNLSNCERR